MNETLKTGVLIGLACVTWTFVMGFTGWYKDPVLLNLFFVVILIEIVLLVLGLRKTAAGQGYGGQVVTGTLMSVVGATIIFCGSLLFTSVVFPNYFQDLRSAHEALLRAQGKTAVEIAEAVQRASAEQTPLASALEGVVGTIGTGIISSLVIAVFARRR